MKNSGFTPLFFIHLPGSKEAAARFADDEPAR
jgi:hypothetical protein